jgi:carboxymethylenebutenolidase
MIERQIAVPTQDGAMNTFITHPERDGPHPVVILYMDAPGVREELRDMARRLGTAGYYVMLPNLYYRSLVEELGPFIGEAGVSVREKFMSLMTTLSIPMVMADTDALMAFVDDDPAASKGDVGAVGYCMSGRYAVSAAVRHPARVTAAASIYGVRLIVDEPDSPHRTLIGSSARVYIAWAEIDHYAPIEQLAPLRDALTQGGVNAEVELFAGVEHGFAFPGRPAFNKPAAERHWERLFSVFDPLRR